MRREDLDHVVKAASDISGDPEIVVVGSQAILGQHPDAPPSLLVSIEADVYPRNHPDRADAIDGAIGDGSRFHETYGYYAHGVGPETPIAPAGWEERLVPIGLTAIRPRGGTVTAWCMDAHDLVLAKLAAGRAHDMRFAEDVLRFGLVDREQLRLGVDLMPATHRELVGDRLTTVLTGI